MPGNKTFYRNSISLFLKMLTRSTSFCLLAATAFASAPDSLQLVPEVNNVRFTGNLRAIVYPMPQITDMIREKEAQVKQLTQDATDSALSSEQLYVAKLELANLQSQLTSNASQCHFDFAITQPYYAASYSILENTLQEKVHSDLELGPSSSLRGLTTKHTIVSLEDRHIQIRALQGVNAQDILVSPPVRVNEAKYESIPLLPIVLRSLAKCATLPANISNKTTSGSSFLIEAHEPLSNMAGTWEFNRNGELTGLYLNGPYHATYTYLSERSELGFPRKITIKATEDGNPSLDIICTIDSIEQVKNVSDLQKFIRVQRNDIYKDERTSPVAVLRLKANALPSSNEILKQVNRRAAELKQIARANTSKDSIVQQKPVSKKTIIGAILICGAVIVYLLKKRSPA